MKDGIHTTEFWGKSVVQIVALVLLCLIWAGYVKPEQAGMVETSLIATIGAPEVLYGLLRNWLKRNEQLQRESGK